jgi:hypothetical protein
MFPNPDRFSGGHSLYIQEPADDREVHRASLLEHFARLVKCRRNQTGRCNKGLILMIGGGEIGEPVLARPGDMIDRVIDG